MPFSILVLEDDDAQMQTYEKVVKADSSLNGTYDLIPAKTVEDALEKINKEVIHAGILDISVPFKSGETAMPQNGAKCLKFLLSEKQFPIIVVSAHVSTIDDITALVPAEFRIPKHLKVLERRSGAHMQAFDYFKGISSLLEITPIIPDAISEIEKEMQAGFWHLWEEWKDLYADFKNDNREETKTFLKRYVSSCLIAEWMKSDSYGNMHHSEFYMYPDSEKRIHTGDILCLDDRHWIVITPPCDLANDENAPDNLTLLACDQEDLGHEKYKTIARPFRDDSAKDTARQKQTDELRGYFTRPSVSTHYLPPLKGESGPFKVKFKEIKLAPCKGDKEKADLIEKRVASLSFHFLPSLLQRYGVYVSRIGQAEVNIDGFRDYLLEKIPENDDR